MPTIINEMEIVTEPPGAEGESGAAAPEGRGAESELQPPPVSPVVIRQVLDRDAARAARVFAH